MTNYTKMSKKKGRSILCFFGFHQWSTHYSWNTNRELATSANCIRCGKMHPKKKNKNLR